MGSWRISADVLARCRFVVSPLAETVAGLLALRDDSRVALGRREWVLAHRPARLLGPIRADVLTALGSPKSPTQLAALTGTGLGSVGGHLRVLLDAGLVTRRRSGRSVLYYRTSTGDAVVAESRA